MNLIKGFIVFTILILTFLLIIVHLKEMITSFTKI